jgi:predicted dehydrogenase
MTTHAPASHRRALVIGFGSIGKRHARLLAELGCDTAVLSRREIDFPQRFASLDAALAGHRPDYVVVADDTDRHAATLASLAALGFEGDVLVEKPIFKEPADLPAHGFRTLRVAYNLRFHPVIARLKALLAGEQVLSVQGYVGQYLPDWRPGTDYRTCYSASRERGGGVLLDLSHDLDYLCWMLGGWTSVAALGGHLSPLEITSDDAFALLMTTPACPVVSLQLNYLDRAARRHVVVNTARHTIVADLIAGRVTVDRETQDFATERDGTYRAMHAALLAGDASAACSAEDGMRTLELIQGAQRAAAEQRWVSR